MNHAHRTGGGSEGDVARSRPWLAWVAPAGLARPPITRRAPRGQLSIVGGSLARPATTAGTLGGSPRRDAVPLIDWFGEGR